MEACTASVKIRGSFHRGSSGNFLEAVEASMEEVVELETSMEVL